MELEYCTLGAEIKCSQNKNYTLFEMQNKIGGGHMLNGSNCVTIFNILKSYIVNFLAL